MLTKARFWPQCWLAVRTIPQDLIGCWDQQKLKAHFSCHGCFCKWFAVSGEKDFATYFLLFYGLVVGKYALRCAMEIQNIQMVVHIFRICFIFGSNVSESRSWIPLQVVDHEQDALWFINKQVQVKILSILKLVSFERLAGNDFWTGHASGGSLGKKT